jgi:hypothetical protein
MSAMPTSAEYRLYAIECRLQAALERDVDVREAMLALAAQWEYLAELNPAAQSGENPGTGPDDLGSARE